MLDLQRALRRLRPLAEDLQDQGRAVEHLGAPGFFEVALLHRGERMVDDDQLRLAGACDGGDVVHQSGAEERRGARIAHRHHARVDDVERDGVGEAHGFGEAPFGLALLVFGGANDR